MIFYYRNGEALKEALNVYGAAEEPFFFVISFDQQEGYCVPLHQIDSSPLSFVFPGNRTGSMAIPQKLYPFSRPAFTLRHTLSYSEYEKQFARVQKELALGHTFLLNLTQQSEVISHFSLAELFSLSKAKYKVWLKNKFVSFSPETFIRINKQGDIATYPMKGTIDANSPDAAALLLNNQKELAEHHTIVDLMRNDLSQVAKNIAVRRFRYLEKLTTERGAIYQTSSEITGRLQTKYRYKIGDLLTRLLPAGSISGAPKSTTLKIIKETENYQRGFYTGIAGLYDGKSLDSCVLIRYLEWQKGKYFYKSGGCITAYSDPQAEYQECLQKIYLPIQPCG